MARANRGGGNQERPLTRPGTRADPREKQVLAYSELGHSNKLIAYALGLSSSTIATLLARARSKLGASGRAIAPTCYDVAKSIEKSRVCTFVKPTHVVSLIETAYRIDLPTEEWLQRIALTATAAFGSSHGTMAFRYDASSEAWVHVRALGLFGLPSAFPAELFNQPDAPPEEVAAIARIFRTLRIGSLRGFIAQEGIGRLGSILDRHGIGEMVGVNGLDPSAHGCMLLIAHPDGHVDARRVHTWNRLAAHISAGNRLRTVFDSILETERDPAQRAEAVLAPSGKIEHAEGPAQQRSARDALQDALARIHAARSERHDASRSVSLWRGLVAGRWSLVEHFERDGRRYYLAHKNDPELARDRALTPREKQVLAYAELGHSNKLIAYALGLSSSTVATLLARARRKVGTPSGFE